jgi:hypothetical protein
MQRFTDPLKALEQAKRQLKHKGFGERHVVRSGYTYRIVNPRLDPAHYGLVVARLFHPTKS